MGTAGPSVPCSKRCVYHGESREPRAIQRLVQLSPRPAPADDDKSPDLRYVCPDLLETHESQLTMSTKKTGRNDPCPCGSGLKYKRCCLERDEMRARPDPSGGIIDALKAEVAEREFDSMEEFQAFADQFIAQQNREPFEDFHGLSREDMNALLYRPFDCPGVVQFAELLDERADAPILILFGCLAEAIGDDGLKPTAKGNLPRKFCRETALAYWGEEGYREQTRFSGINQERDFHDLHVTRVVAELAGLVRKYRGRFVLTKKAKQHLAESGPSGAWPLLFRTYAREFHWGYGDRYPELHIIQYAFAFTLYLLDRYGDEECSANFYRDAFLRAFPMALDEAPDLDIFPADRMVGSCYRYRALQGFARMLGLAHITPLGNPHMPDDYRVTATPLLHRAVRFTNQAPPGHA